MKQRVRVKTEEKLAEEKQPVEQPVEQPEKQCHHYWVIEVANGPKSMGTCKNCGEIKEFFNAFPDMNPMKRKSNPLELPRMTDVEIDKDSES